jgi:hypothetical protein
MKTSCRLMVHCLAQSSNDANRPAPLLPTLPFASNDSFRWIKVNGKGFPQISNYPQLTLSAHRAHWQHECLWPKGFLPFFNCNDSFSSSSPLTTWMPLTKWFQFFNCNDSFSSSGPLTTWMPLTKLISFNSSIAITLSAHRTHWRHESLWPRGCAAPRLWRRHPALLHYAVRL